MASNDLLAALVKLHERGGRAAKPVHVVRGGKYLSGNPYLWSSYGDRAFVMDEDDARELVKKFPEELRPATILPLDRSPEAPPPFSPLRAVLHVAAPNDRNGNPRRCFVAWDIWRDARNQTHRELVRVHDEGYGGCPAELCGPTVADLGRVEVSASEYRDWLQVGEGVLTRGN